MPVITCEHASNQIPKSFEHLFTQAQDDLNSHKGWDDGAFFWSEIVSKGLKTDLYSYHWSRLLIDINRSEHSHELLSKYTEGLSGADKNYLITTYYRPYRRKIRNFMEHAAEWGHTLLHLAFHSFTPIWEGQERQVDIGLLFDEDRPDEVAFCEHWKRHLTEVAPGLIVKFNEPYLGKDDGFCTRMRTKISPQNYLGIELEVNQKFVASDKDFIGEILLNSLKLTLDDY